MKLIICSSELNEFIIPILRNDILLFEYNFDDTYDKTITLLSSFLKNNIKDLELVGFVFHGQKDNNFKISSDINININPNSYNANDIDPIVKLILIISKYCKTNRFDLISCCIMNNPLYNQLRSFIKEKTGMILAASDDLTGNIKNADWILESDNINLLETYFRSDTNNILSNLNIELSLVSFSSLDLGTAINIAQDIKNATDNVKNAFIDVKNTFEDVKVLTAIIDEIPGLNVIPCIFRSLAFIQNVVDGKATLFDALIFTLDITAVASSIVPSPFSKITSTMNNTIKNKFAKKLIKSADKMWETSGDLKDGVENMSLIVQGVNENDNKKLTDACIGIVKYAKNKHIDSTNLVNFIKNSSKARNAGLAATISNVTAENNSNNSVNTIENDINTTYEVIEEKIIYLMNNNEIISDGKMICLYSEYNNRIIKISNYNNTEAHNIILGKDILTRESEDALNYWNNEKEKGKSRERIDESKPQIEMIRTYDCESIDSGQIPQLYECKRVGKLVEEKVIVKTSAFTGKIKTVTKRIEPDHTTCLTRLNNMSDNDIEDCTFEVVEHSNGSIALYNWKHKQFLDMNVGTEYLKLTGSFNRTFEIINLSNIKESKLRPTTITSAGGHESFEGKGDYFEYVYKKNGLISLYSNSSKQFVATSNSVLKNNVGQAPYSFIKDYNGWKQYSHEVNVGDVNKLPRYTYENAGNFEFKVLKSSLQEPENYKEYINRKDKAIKEYKDELDARNKPRGTM